MELNLTSPHSLPPSVLMKHRWSREDLNDLAERKRRKKTDEGLEEKRAVWRERPDVYAKERLNVNLTEEQKQILYSVKDNRRTAVKAHHSLGKTFVAAIALLWWVDCWSAHIGYITAPTWGQALRLTFKQCKRLAILNNLDLEILDSGIIRDKDNYKATERFLQALNAENGEGFQGEHTAPILIVLEEAVGVPNYIYDAAGGLMTSPKCRQLEIANPTDEATNFGKSCESPNYEVFSFSALDHPNIKAELKGDSPPFEGAVSLLWLFEMLRDEADATDTDGEDHFEFYTLEVLEAAINGVPITKDSPKCFYKPTAYFQGRVLGDFPTEASNKVIPSGWLKSLPVIPINFAHKKQIGCDTARFGDDRSTMISRIGAVAVKARETRKFDTSAIVTAIVEMVEELVAMCATHGVKITKKDVEITIDVTGGLGTGPHDNLKDDGYNVTAVNSSESAKDPELYKNKRSELWFDSQGRFKQKRMDFSRLSPDIKKKLIKELGTPTYKVQSGKKVVEEKADIKKRLGESPDVADGFNLAFYEQPRKVIYKQPSVYSQSSY